MTRMRAALVVVVATLAGCGTVQPELVAGPAPHRREVRRVDPGSVTVDDVRFVGTEAYAWFDGATGRALTFDDVLVRARASTVVIVGEQHDQASHHELERRVVASLAQSQPQLVVGLEMLTWNLQAPLGRYNEGDIDADALAAAVDWPHAWGFPFDLYKPIFVDGHRAGARFLALNAPRDLVRAVRRKGVDGLAPDELRALPDLDLGDAQHRAWFKGIFAADGHPVSDSDVDSFYVAQVVWDESMADRTARALESGAKQVVVIAGIGHVARGRGIPERVERRRPGATVLSIVPLSEVDAETVTSKLRAAVVDGEADVIAIPRFEEALAL